jgi:lipopolysaccharide transport system ATP-binding protein
MTSEIALQVDGLSKEYSLGTINHGTLYRDLQSWWARMRSRPDPNALIRDERLYASEVAAFGEVSASRGKRFLALDNVSFQVMVGETFGIIGRNGAGKSTLLKILSRITAPTAGAARIRGRIASLLEVGTGFHPELTGRENAYLNGAILGMRRDEVHRKFDAIVGFAQLERFIDTPVKRYSSGMYVRLAFSVAAHLDAEILIVDEVLAVGDYEFQKRCLRKMREVSTQGKTVLLVSHNMTAVQGLCTRAILLQRGKVVADDKPAQVIEAYTAKRDEEALANGLPLARRDDRTGNGAFRFVEARTSSGNGSQREPATGEDMVIRLVLENTLQRTLHDVNVSLGIDNYLGERVTILTTQAVGATIANLAPGRTDLDFHIPHLPFVPGRYYFTLFGTAGGVVTDWIQSASSFQVDHGDFYGTGENVPSGQGSILIPFAVCLVRPGCQ